MRGGFEEADAVTVFRKPIRGGEAGDAGADDGDGESGRDCGRVTHEIHERTRRAENGTIAAQRSQKTEEFAGAGERRMLDGKNADAGGAAR